MGQRVVGPIARERRFARRPGAEPFRIVVAGAFGGDRTDRASLRERRPLAVDLGRFGDVLARSSPLVRFEDGTEWTVRALEDLHPDRLGAGLPSLQALARLRARLLEPGEGVEHPRSATTAEGAMSLEALLQGRPLVLDDPALPRSLDLSKFLRSVVAGSVVHEPGPEAEALASGVDEARAEKLRETLRHPSFRGLEALWRAVHRFVASVDLGEMTSLHLLDVTEEELSGPLEELPAALERAGVAWNLTVLDTRLAADAAGIRRARFLAELAAKLDAPLLADVAPQVLADQHLGAWTSVNWPQPCRLGMAFPAVLVRLPYGERMDPIEAFPFEELPAEPAPSDFVWGSAAIASAQTLAMGELELTDLPSCAVERGGEKVLVPVTEVALDERDEHAALGLGLTPLVARRNRAALQIAGVRALGGGPLR